MYMRSYKTKAIIIKQYEVGEADRIIIAFSRDFGRLALKARGVRKILAKLKGHLELFTHSKLEIHATMRGSIDTITGAETIDSFRNIRGDLESTSRVYFILEFINKVLPEREGHERIFDLLHYTLSEINKNKSRDKRIILSSHLCLQIFKELGFYPHFRECIRCGEPLEAGNNYFDFDGAGTVCGRCLPTENLIPISDRAIIGLRLLIENEDEELKSIKMPLDTLEEIYNIIERYAQVVIDSELKSKEFVRHVD
jgi:DNA repair protein RecO (recombination protein O)